MPLLTLFPRWLELANAASINPVVTLSSVGYDVLAFADHLNKILSGHIASVFKSILTFARRDLLPARPS